MGFHSEAAFQQFEREQAVREFLREERVERARPAPHPDSHYLGPDRNDINSFVVYEGARTGGFYWSLTEWDGELCGEPAGPFPTAYAAWKDAA